MIAQVLAEIGNVMKPQTMPPVKAGSEK